MRLWVFIKEESRTVVFWVIMCISKYPEDEGKWVRRIACSHPSEHMVT